jgi:hypothetical protein
MVMANDEELQKELRRLQSQVEYEQVRAQNLADRKDWEQKNQKEKSNGVLAIVSVLLFCTVLIILGLTGILN